MRSGKFKATIVFRRAHFVWNGSGLMFDNDNLDIGSSIDPDPAHHHSKSVRSVEYATKRVISLHFDSTSVFSRAHLV